MVLFVGTSLAVGVTEMILGYTASVGVPVFLVDPGFDAAPYPGVKAIPAKAEELLPAVCEQLGVANA